MTDNEAATVEDVTEWHQQDESDDVPDLPCGDEPAERPRREPQISAGCFQQGLDRVDR